MNRHEIESFCNSNYKKAAVDKISKDAGVLFDSRVEGVKYRDTDEPVPPFVVKCAIAPYLENAESINKTADMIAAEFDKESFIAVLEKVADINNRGYKHPKTLFPLGRFGDKKHVSQLISARREWDDWYTYSKQGRLAEGCAERAILLNDSREAMLFADRNHMLSIYAEIRGMDEDSLRDQILCEFSFDSSGKKLLELGNTTIEVSLNSDLTLGLFDKVTGKVVKSIPKRNADEIKYEIAKADYDDLKKNIKKVIKQRNEMLFNDFLSAKTRTAESWISSYVNNPVLHKVAELIVWTQNEKTFTLAESGAIDCDGIKYIINENIPIGVANPIEMTQDNIKAWQKYFVSNNLKQPFKQIWEPVVHVENFSYERYKGIPIPFYRFKGKEKHGIRIDDYNFHNDITIFFDDCTANVKRLDWVRHEINMEDRFEIESIYFVKLTRRVNHVLAYLDSITIYDRIINRDTDIIDLLDDYNIAQLSEFIKFALENNSDEITALLLEYRNKKYPEYMSVNEFTLD